MVAAILVVFEIMNFELECLKNDKMNLVSPVLGQTLVWFLSRFSKTYLMNQSQHPSILQTCGPLTSGIQVQQCC